MRMDVPQHHVNVGFEPGNCEGWISGYVGVTAINAPILLTGYRLLITHDATTNLLTAVDSASIDSEGISHSGLFRVEITCKGMLVLTVLITVTISQPILVTHHSAILLKLYL